MAQLALPQSGDVVGGKYRIERLLGRGGMGAVFEATHCVTEKRFAIKWLLADPASSEVVTARFVREAQVAGRCDHRNIVAVYDIDRESGTLFMVMELLHGESLADRLTLHGRISYREACRLLVPCIEAVGEAHAAGIIHRDLKPANIFVCRARGREPEFAKVLDFGVSRFAVPTAMQVGTNTANGAVLGTPFYMAPEQMRGHAIDERVDVYSMGVTLYEVIAGVRPYDANTFGDLLVRVTEGKRARLKNLIADLPPSLSDVVDRAMSSDRDARFPSMDALARALEPFTNNAGHALLSLQSSLSNDTPWAGESGYSGGGKRRRSLWIGVGAGALLLGVLAWPLLHRSEPEPPVRPDSASAPDRAPVPPPSAASERAANLPSQVVARPALERVDAGVPDVGKVPALVSGRRGHVTRTGKGGQSTGTKGRAGDVDPPERESAAPGSSEPRPRAKNRAPARLDRSDF